MAATVIHAAPTVVGTRNLANDRPKTVVDFDDTQRDHAQLTSFRLSYANLSGAHLRHANIADADLNAAELSHSNLGGADLSGAKLILADGFCGHLIMPLL